MLCFQNGRRLNNKVISRTAEQARGQKLPVLLHAEPNLIMASRSPDQSNSYNRESAARS